MGFNKFGEYELSVHDSTFGLHFTLQVARGGEATHDSSILRKLRNDADMHRNELREEYYRRLLPEMDSMLGVMKLVHKDALNIQRMMSSVHFAQRYFSYKSLLNVQYTPVNYSTGKYSIAILLYQASIGSISHAVLKDTWIHTTFYNVSQETRLAIAQRFVGAVTFAEMATAYAATIDFIYPKGEKIKKFLENFALQLEHLESIIDIELWALSCFLSGRAVRIEQHFNGSVPGPCIWPMLSRRCNIEDYMEYAHRRNLLDSPKVHNYVADESGIRPRPFVVSAASILLIQGCLEVMQKYGLSLTLDIFPVFCTSKTRAHYYYAFIVEEEE